EYERAVEVALDAARRLDGDFPGSAHSAGGHAQAAIVAARAGDSSVARAEAEGALRQARGPGNPSALAISLMAYGFARIADDPPAALTALDEGISLQRQGANPAGLGTAYRLAAGVRVRSGDLPHAARDLREAVERSHQQSARFAFYNCVLWG